MNYKLNLQIKKILNERKSFAENVAEQNLSYARQNKNFCELEKQENSLKIEIAKIEFENGNSENLINKLKNVQKNKENILKTLNLTEIDLIPNYFCKNCNDTGVDINNKICQCQKQIQSQILISESGFNGKFSSFEDAKIESEKEKVLFNKMKLWCEKFPNVKNQSIFITGEVGVGKSFLCSAMANQLVKQNNFVFFTTAFMMNQNFLDYCKSSEKSDKLEKFLNADVLFIDDLGSEPIINNITLNYLYLILNERLLANKATIINSNLMPDEILNRYGERIFSRIMNKRSGLVLSYNGKDRRINS